MISCPEVATRSVESTKVLLKICFIYIFLKKVAGLGLQLSYKETPTSVFLLNLLNSKEHLFIQNISCGCFWSYSRSHSFSTYAKFTEKLIFLTPWYAHVSLSRNHSLNCWFTRYERLDYWNFLNLYYNKLKKF